MPNTSSAKKRLRQNVVRNERNRSVRTSVRSSIRKVREDVKFERLETIDDDLKIVIRKLDRAAADRIMHPNKAARLKSRLNKAVKEVKAAKAEAAS